MSGGVSLPKSPGAGFWRFGRWNFKKCSRCGLVWLEPVPAQAYLDEIYKKSHTENGQTEGTKRNATSLGRNAKV
jgi:hypothetical protein